MGHDIDFSFEILYGKFIITMPYFFKVGFEVVKILSELWSFENLLFISDSIHFDKMLLNFLAFLKKFTGQLRKISCLDHFSSIYKVSNLTFLVIVAPLAYDLH